MSSTDIFPRIVVDPVELRLVDQGVQLRVQRACGSEVVPERLLDDDTRVLGETCVREPADDRAEERWRDLEVEDRARRVAHCLRDLRVRRGVGEVAVDIGEPIREPREDVLVDHARPSPTMESRARATS